MTPQQPKTYSQELVDANLLKLNGRISEPERLRLISAIREKYEKKTADLLSNNSNICEK